MFKQHPLRLALAGVLLGSVLVACDAMEKFFVQDLGFEIIEIDSGKYFAPKLSAVHVIPNAQFSSTVTYQEKGSSFSYCGGYEVTQAEPVGENTCLVKAGEVFAYAPKDQNVSKTPFACGGCPGDTSGIKIFQGVQAKRTHACTISIKRTGSENECGRFNAAPGSYKFDQFDG